MEIWVLFGVFTLLLLIGTPVAFCLGIASLATVLYMGLPPIVVFQQLNSGMNVFAHDGDPVLHLCRRPDGARRHRRPPDPPRRRPGRATCAAGSGQVNIVASTLFGGISGSAVADASAVGGIMIPQMEERGYATDYSRQRHVEWRRIIALLIPPSHNMIIYSIAAGGTISVADLFTAGIVPGFLLAAALMVTAYVVAVRRGYPAEPFPGFRMLGYFLVSAVPGILLIVIIFGGVRSGVFTATESSCIAVVYALLVTLFVYREMNWESFVEATLGAVRTTAMVLLVIGTASAFGWLMAFLQVPQATIALHEDASRTTRSSSCC